MFGHVGLVSGSGFLEDGQEYVYQEWGIQNAGTMDYSPSAAGISWKSTVRIQVSPHHASCGYSLWESAGNNWHLSVYQRSVVLTEYV